MDCFSKLPPELRIRIFSKFSSTATIFRLMQASPAMFSQYKVSKTTIRRHYVANLLTGDRHEDLLQDALGLLYLGPSDNRPDNHVMKYIIRQWNSKALPNPFEEKDQDTIAKLYKLFSSISMFVEDYISKATSSNPPQAYLCLPQITNPNRGLYYKEHSFSPRHITLDDLMSSERHFLLWAFIKYEMFSKVQGPKAVSLMEDNEYMAISKRAIDELTDCEDEAIKCVLEYVDAVYGALYTVSTRCSTRHASSALPDKPASPIRLFYPDNLYFSPFKAWEDMDLPSTCLPVMVGYACNFPEIGFDLLRNTVLFANKTQPEDMRSWFYTIHSPYTRLQYPISRHYLLPLLNRMRTDYLYHQDDSPRSFLMRRLSHTHASLSYIQVKIFRQRAWVFLDDTRVFRMGLSHFPTIEELDNQGNTAFGTEAMLEEKERQRLRLLQLCQYRRESGIEETQREGREYLFSANGEDSIPRFFDPPGNRGVTTFWEYF
ncbi:uncharacterized protein FPRO_14068 [Fusarium proliferatum ET1]|uniref:Uncharacterized protein n=1 Tax=Fusarium proliferatum (strain ET1) TaxID=1227346 RepID=A0A1L7VV55_FUSPR|nr:uncharacterized protein FPRO_14068 [Fusarium proliferatum ET1]CZR44307.1 uncharacterized protein FPRO_14068 [Fusarium proliferatum ET1]